VLARWNFVIPTATQLQEYKKEITKQKRCAIFLAKFIFEIIFKKEIVAETLPIFENTININYNSTYLSLACKSGFEMVIPENQRLANFTYTKKGRWFGPSLVRCAGN
jgi:predicted transcriptional regulator